MTALNIRDLGENRRAALANEARARGLSVSELVRQLIDEGLGRAEADHVRRAWIAEARAGREYEAQHLVRHGPLLTRYRRMASSDLASREPPGGRR